MNDELRSSRQVIDGDGEYREEWYCDEPPHGSLYTVIRQEWDADGRVRKIFEVKLGG